MKYPNENLTEMEKNVLDVIISLYKKHGGYVLHSDIINFVNIKPRQLSGVCGSLAKKGWICGFGNWNDLEITCMAKNFYKIKNSDWGCNHDKCFCQQDDKAID